MAVRLPDPFAIIGKIISFKWLQAEREFYLEFYNYINFGIVKSVSWIRIWNMCIHILNIKRNKTTFMIYMCSI
jgi:hypothetical protein